MPLPDPNLQLPASLVTQEHKIWMQQALKVLDNLQGHIEQAHRAGVPGMDEHRRTEEDHRKRIHQFLNVYFPNG